MANEMPLMELTKFTSKDVVVVGDIITFTIVADNISDIVIGNVEGDPVFVYDLLPSELEFVIGSVKVDNVPKPTFDINAGINLGSINPGKSKSLVFDARVISNTNDTIQNTANGSYSYIIPGSFPRKGNVNSNTIDICIFDANLDIVKKADKDVVVLKDIITYTVRLRNTGNLNLLNVIFKDDLPEGTELINGTFEINGNVINNVDLSKGVNIGGILANDTSIVEYKVKVLSSTCSLKLENKASANYTYILPDGSTGKQSTKETTTSTTLVFLSINSFKQLSIEEYLKIPPQKPDVEEVNLVNGDVEIIKCHVIETGSNMSVEGQVITGYKLVIHGVLRLIIQYTACEPCQSVHAAHYDVPFSTFVVLPENYKVGSKMDIDTLVEDVYFRDMDCRTVFTNTTLLINVKTC